MMKMEGKNLHFGIHIISKDWLWIVFVVIDVS